MGARLSAIVLGLGLLAFDAALAGASRPLESGTAVLASPAVAGPDAAPHLAPHPAPAASLLPAVLPGQLHPRPGLYMLAAQRPSPGCVWMDESVEKAPTLPGSAVVLIHGLDDSGDVWRELAPALHEAGRCVLFFEYPNDQGIALSADALAGALRLARARGITRVDLVCHSMGGLVARDVLTRPGHYNGVADARPDLPDVGQLILVATPNAGAPLAYVRAPNDLIERSLAWRHAQAPLREIFNLSTDGDGQAGIDLRPGSAFLQDLNSRPGPTAVRTTVIVAQAIGELEHADGVPAPNPDDESAATPDRPRGMRARVRSWWSRVVSQVIAALGDGAVPTSSARLHTADETLHVRCSHVGLLKDDPVGGWILGVTGQSPERAPALALVLERIAVDVDVDLELAAEPAAEKSDPPLASRP